jgi:hypothetical protein
MAKIDIPDELYDATVAAHAARYQSAYDLISVAAGEALVYWGAVLLRKAWPSAAVVQMQLPRRDAFSPQEVAVLDRRGGVLARAKQLSVLFAELDEHSGETEAKQAIGILINAHLQLDRFEPGDAAVDGWSHSSVSSPSHLLFRFNTVRITLPEPGSLPPTYLVHLRRQQEALRLDPRG